MISIIVPTFAERENIPKLVDSIKRVLVEDYEIIFVNDANPDGSREVIEKMLDQHLEIKAVFNPVRYGKTRAIIDGLRKSVGDIIVLLDADLQYLPDDIPRLIKHLDFADIVNSRRVNRKDALHRKIESILYNLLIRLFFGLKVRDNDSGLKVFKRKVLVDIVPMLKPNWHRYLLVLARKKGYVVKEIAIEHHKRIGGRSKFSHPLRLIKGLIDLFEVKKYTIKAR